jgi:hypothetical protein
MKLMISCKEATTAIVKRESQAPRLADRFRLWFHLLICRFCRLFAIQNKIMIKLLRHHEHPVGFTDEEKKNLSELIKNEESAP